MSHFRNPEDVHSAKYVSPGELVPHPNIRDVYVQSTMLAGAETVMPLEKVYLIMNCPGPDSHQHLDQSLKVHKLRVERIWFTIPAGSSALAPGDSTLYLTIQEISQQNNVVDSDSRASINNGTTHHYHGNPAQFPPVAPNYVSQVNFVNGDPGQAPGHLRAKTVFTFPVFVPTTTVESNTLVVAENKSDVVHNFSASTTNFHTLRVRLMNRVISTTPGTPDVWEPWSVINLDMRPGQAAVPAIGAPAISIQNAVRIFVEMHLWVEKRP